MDLLKTIRQKREAIKRVPFTISLKQETIDAITELANEGNVSVSFLASEILEMGLEIGKSTQVLTDKIGELAENIFANQLPPAKQVLKKANAQRRKKPVKFGGRR